MLMIDDFRPAPRREKSLQENTNNLKADTPFITPDQAAADSLAPPAAAVVPPMILLPPSPALDFNSFKPQTPEPNRFKKLLSNWPPTKKQLIGLVAFIILIGSGIGAAVMLRQTPALPVATVATPVKKVAPKPVVPTTVASNLSGLQVDPTLNAKPVTAVMIENSPDSRPQSGLSQANVVYEAIAEGGITRFLALYQDTNPGDIGPIRSVRPYYLQWARGFDAPLAHVGGSPEALETIRALGAKDLDQFFNAGAYRRISARSAPHNVYSAVDTLTQLSIAKGYTASVFKPWGRKAESAVAQATARSIDLTLSGPTYNAHYDYDPATNSYKRSQAGTPHTDANGNVQISPKVVIGLVIPLALQADGKHLDYGTIGSGQAYVFQNGTLTVGQWNKATENAGMSFTDAAGAPLPLNPGQTWLTAVTAAEKITAAP